MLKVEDFLRFLNCMGYHGARFNQQAQVKTPVAYIKYHAVRNGSPLYSMYVGSADAASFHMNKNLVVVDLKHRQFFPFNFTYAG